MTQLHSKCGRERPEIETAESYSVRMSSIEWSSAVGASTCSLTLDADSKCAEVNVVTLRINAEKAPSRSWPVSQW